MVIRNISITTGFYPTQWQNLINFAIENKASDWRLSTTRTIQMMNCEFQSTQTCLEIKVNPQTLVVGCEEFIKLAVSASEHWNTRRSEDTVDWLRMRVSLVCHHCNRIEGMACRNGFIKAHLSKLVAEGPGIHSQ